MEILTHHKNEKKRLKKRRCKICCCITPIIFVLALIVGIPLGIWMHAKGIKYEFGQSEIYYARSVVRLSKWAIEQASDVSSIIFFHNFLQHSLQKSCQIRECSHRTSNVLGAFWTYLPTLIRLFTKYISLCSKIRCALTYLPT